MGLVEGDETSTNASSDCNSTIRKFNFLLVILQLPA
jgi:hypothetical protein